MLTVNFVENNGDSSNFLLFKRNKQNNMVLS